VLGLGKKCRIVFNLHIFFELLRHAPTALAMARGIYLVALLAAALASPPPPSYSAFSDVDIDGCAYPCVRAFQCGLGYTVPCDPLAVSQACDAIPECVTFNSNSWLKGCGNASCGGPFEPSPGTTVWVKEGGYTPPAPVQLVEDTHYPPEQPGEEEAYAAGLPTLVEAGLGWAVLLPPGGAPDAPVNVSVGSAAVPGTNLTLLAAGAAGWGALGAGPFAVVEQLFARWGALSLLSVPSAEGQASDDARARDWHPRVLPPRAIRSRGRRLAPPPSVAPPPGEAARLSRTVGSALSVTPVSYASLVVDQPSYYVMADYLPTDYLGQRAANMSGPEGETTWAAAASFLPPQRDYASIGAIAPHAKYSVSPDGRVKSAYGNIYTPALNRTDTGPGGLLVWDPAAVLVPQTLWPATNWSATKSGLVGGYLRAVVTAGVDDARGVGFEQIAFAPASEPAASVYLRLRAATGPGAAGGQGEAFYNASLDTPLVPQPLDANVFYEALFAEQALWEGTLGGNSTASSAAALLSLPGQEGRRQVDTAWGSVVAALSLYVGLEPNYGDGGAYMAPNSSLTSNIAPVDLTLLELNLLDLAADRVAYVLDSFVREDGSMPECDDVESGGFGDALADYGETLDLVVRVARAQLAWRPATVSGPWMAARLPHLVALANYTLQMRRNATAAGPPPGAMGHGLVWGSPEHDTAHEPGLYFHNSAWLVRGLRVAGQFLRDEGGAGNAGLAASLLAEAPLFLADLSASLEAAVARADGPGSAVTWVPPLAESNSTPFGTMTDSILASYSNFRYFPELLAADVIADDSVALGLMAFRETHAGTFVGMTRFEGHLDDMPSAGYAFADLRYGRLASFWLFAYGHLADYVSRGTFTATEQVPWEADSLGVWRDYLWEYLEGGIDMCVPSLLVATQATRWALVFERGFDATGNTTMWIGLGSPRRWWTPDGGGDEGGFGAERMLTSYGLVAFWAQPAAAAGDDAADVHVVLTTPPFRPSPSDSVTFAVTVRSAVPGHVVANATVFPDTGNSANTTVALAGPPGAETVWVTASGLSGAAGGVGEGLTVGFVVHAAFAPST
jgi:hypothetical protein